MIECKILDASYSRTSWWERWLPWGGGQALSGDVGGSSMWVLGPSPMTGRPGGEEKDV